MGGKYLTYFIFHRLSLNVYLRLAATQAMGERGHCLWITSTSERGAVNEYLAQYQGQNIVQYLPGIPTTSTVNF